MPQAVDHQSNKEITIKAPSLEINSSRQFSAWLEEQQLSLAFTTYQAGKVFFVGLRQNGHLSIFERTLARPMGLYATESSLYVSTLYQLWRFENICGKSEIHPDYDAFYVPQVSFVTGDLDIHDIAVDSSGQRVFVNTLFSCLATVSESHSFVPLWQPPFISKLAAEDRCHLNGVAMLEGQPTFVTAVSQCDIAEGWREHRQSGGCVIDVPSNEVVVSGLSMPHSPRCYQNKLWLLNSGTGEFGWVDLDLGQFEPVTFCPGYLRGLAFQGDFAVVGVSKPRHNQSFTGLALDERLEKKGVNARCGLLIIDLRSGDIVHSLSFEGIVEELYDVTVLTGIRQPSAIGFKTDEIRRVLHVY